MSLPFVPFYPSDWLAGTRGLSAAETGIYITLVAMMYEREAPIDMPADRLARLCGCTVKAFEAARDALLKEGKLIVENGGLWNARVEKECGAREIRSEKAKRSAEYRWQKGKQNQANDDANASPKQCLDHANHNHNHKKEREANASPKKSRGSRLPDDWFLPVTWGEWAITEGLATDTIRNEAERFRDHWHGASGQRGVKADWQATWRNWVRTFKDRQPTLKAITGGKQDERRAFDQTIRTVADHLTAGTARIDNSSRDPFAQRPGGNADAGQHGSQPLLRS